MTQSLAVGGTAVEELYERNAGRVFAYCYVRVGSQNVAEWAVTATFDRARAALANGGLPEQELDWLLRTADKFCAPRLRLRHSPLAEGAVVLDDWDGLTFDEIASRLEASRETLERARGELSPWRRILGAFNVTPLASWLKSVLAGASAVKTTAAVVAITGAVVVVGTPVGDRLHAAVRPSAKPKPATPNSNAPAASRPGPAKAIPGAEGDGPLPAAGKAKVKRGASQAVKALPGGGISFSPPSSSGLGAGSSSPSASANPQPGQPAGSAGPPSDGGSPTPTLPSGSLERPPVPAPTLPVETPTVDSVPLPAPPPTPDPPSLPDPGGEVPSPPPLPTVDAPPPPKVPSPPQLPDLTKLP